MLSEAIAAVYTDNVDVLVWKPPIFKRVRKTAKSGYQLRNVRLSTRRMERVGSHYINFHEKLFLSNFRKYVAKIHISFKSDKKTCSLYKDQYAFMIVSR
jgi:hypothetical protein